MGTPEDPPKLHALSIEKLGVTLSSQSGLDPLDEDPIIEEVLELISQIGPGLTKEGPIIGEGLKSFN